MFRRTVLQRVVVGMALAAFLALAVPVPAEAGGFDPARVEDLWTAVWGWLSGLWGGTDAGASLFEPSTGGSTCQPGADAGACVDPNGRNTPATCQGDAGICIDPDG